MSLIIIGLNDVSFRPPYPDVITALPKSDDSIAVLPKGSSHKEGTTEIEVFLYKLIILS